MESETLHRVEFGQVRKYRNAKEYHTIPTATCGAITVSGHGDLMPALCRKLLDAGITGRVDAYRDKTPVFLGGTVEKWASGKAMTGEQPEHLKSRGR